MKRSPLILLVPMLAVVMIAEAAQANQNASVATTTTSCDVDQKTRVKDLDPVRSELLLQVPGMDQRLISIVDLFPVDPGLLGVNKVKGKAFMDWFCFDGVAQRSRGRDKEKFGPSGAAAATQRLPAGANCFFSGVNVDFAGSRKLPAGTEVEVMVGSQAVDPGADPDCFDAETICLQSDNRFKVEVSWRDFSGQTGDAIAFPRSDDSGTFFFFDADRTELLLKVLDGCQRNGHYWVFYAATTDVEYEVTVTDTLANQPRVYDNPLGQPAPPILDTQAFATCP